MAYEVFQRLFVAFRNGDHPARPIRRLPGGQRSYSRSWQKPTMAKAAAKSVDNFHNLYVVGDVNAAQAFISLKQGADGSALYVLSAKQVK